MHVGAKKMAFLGLLLALAVLLIILSGILEFNTLFLLAGASFGVGIAIRECGIRLGAGFYLASILLGLILAPNKLYCITFAAFGFYIVVVEYLFEKLADGKSRYNRKVIFWVMKYVLFNLMYIPTLLLMPSLIYQGELSSILLFGLFLAGQVGIVIFDKAYIYFQGSIWGKFRNHI